MTSALRPSAPRLAGLVPYDPKYLPAQTMLSANESPFAPERELGGLIAERVAEVNLNRYPDPLANRLRDQIAQANGLAREQVLIGNGGDELLFDLVLAWGGAERSVLECPPTFSAYRDYALITNTKVVDIARTADFAVDEEAVCARLGQGDIDFLVVTSPNNPSGNLTAMPTIERLLSATDALVLVDEAYCEFAGVSAVPLLARFENLVVLRTFSKAYRLAGLRVGYLLAHANVINELLKVRQPYSVDAVSQAIASCVFEHRAAFAESIALTVAQRGRVFGELERMAPVTAYPSDANYILFKVEGAAQIWEALYARGVLVRDFSRQPGLADCLRVSIGSPEENDRFLEALREILTERERP
ncbi:MAG: histidinol-phosphate transaminase [Eggerthellaceae bacterium]|nr:histidinol-phosphate transaminase [Eggerthellaceae bacterium]